MVTWTFKTARIECLIFEFLNHTLIQVISETPAAWSGAISFLLFASQTQNFESLFFRFLKLEYVIKGGSYHGYQPSFMLYFSFMEFFKITEFKSSFTSKHLNLADLLRWLVTSCVEEGITVCTLVENKLKSEPLGCISVFIFSALEDGALQELASHQIR